MEFFIESLEKSFDMCTSRFNFHEMTNLFTSVQKDENIRQNQFLFNVKTNQIQGNIIRNIL